MTKTNKIIAEFVLAAACAAFAQNADAKKEAPEQAISETDKIFSEILQNLPQQAKAQVDSARQAATQTQNAGSSDAAEMLQIQQHQREKALMELPDDVRHQVEKAIINIEEGNQQRQLQFMEKKEPKSEHK